MSCLCPADVQLITIVQTAPSLVPGSSTGEPIIFHIIHGLMSLGPRDCYGVAMGSEFLGVRHGGKRATAHPIRR
jgi:hypothetical protein